MIQKRTETSEHAYRKYNGKRDAFRKRFFNDLGGLGASWRPLGVSWVPLGDPLGVSCDLLGPRGGLLGPLWAPLGDPLGSWASWEPLEDFFEASWVPPGAF